MAASGPVLHLHGGHAPTFLAIVRGPDHVFDFANERYQQLVGRRDIVAKRVRDAFPEVEQQGFIVILDRVFETGRRALPVRVRDTGEGIDEAFLPCIFDRFRQVDASQDQAAWRARAGLAIVRQLLDLHHGQVTVETPGRGRGSTFVVTLPRLSRQPAAAAPLVTPHVGSDVAGLRVLVVDDEEDGQVLVKRLLEDGHASVTTAASVAEATRLLGDRRYDVLVSDIGMPGEDGLSLVRRVRALGLRGGGDIPAIAANAYARPEDRDESLRAGFQVHPAKPVESAELVARVASVARRSAGRS